MQPAGSPYGKYIRRDGAITSAQLAAHLAGSVTLAAPPVGADGLARLAALDIDRGGERAVQRALDAAHALGLAAFAEAHNTPGGHCGGRVFLPLSAGTHRDRARLLAAQVRDSARLPADTELWPTAADLRLPFGVHRHTGRRSVLLLPDGRRLDLNDPRQLAAGVAAVSALDNDPAAVCPELPALAPRAERTAHQGRSSIAELNAGASIADMVGLLESHFGCRYAHTARSGAMLRCGCGNHSHGDAKPSLSVFTGTDGKVRVRSYSPACKWHRAADYAAVYIEAHGLTYRDLAAPPVRTSGGYPVTPGDDDRRHTDPAQLTERKAEAERKRRARAEGAAATLQAVHDRAAEDAELAERPTVAAVLRELLTIAGARAWCRPSKAQIAERLSCSERTVQRALAWLEGRYIATEEHTSDTGPAWRGGPETARRTFLREPLYRTETPQTVKAGETRRDGGMSPVHVAKHDLATCLSACEGGATAAPAPDPGPLDDAGWAELLTAVPEPLADDVSAELAAWPSVWPEPQIEPAPPPVAVVFEGGAAFDPAAVGQVAPPQRPRLLEEHFQALRDLYLWLATRGAPTTPAELPVVVEAEAEEEPEVRGPPRDPEKARRYWALLGKARKPTTGAAQRRALRLQAAALEEWYPAAEAGALRQPAPTSKPRVQLALTDAPATQEPVGPAVAPPSQATSRAPGDSLAYVRPVALSAPVAAPPAFDPYGPGYVPAMVDRLRQLATAA